jgi:hypothetical protein
MSALHSPPPRRRNWTALALIGFVAGVLTVIVVVRYLRPYWHG